MQPGALFWKFSFIYTSVCCLGDQHFKYVETDLQLMYAISLSWSIAL